MFNIGLFTEYDDPIAVHDPVVQVSAAAINLAANQGVFYQAMGAPSEAITQREFEIYGRSLTVQEGVVGDGAGTGWNSSNTASLPMTANAVKNLTVGTVIQVEDEVVILKSVDRSANTIDVWKRGAGGTTGASHADTIAYKVVGFAGDDTDLKNVESFSELTNKFVNYAGSVFEVIDFTKMAQILKVRGLSEGQVFTLRKEAMLRVATKLAYMSINSRKEAGNNTNQKYMSAGLLQQLTDTASGTRPILRYNADSSPFSETILKDALEAAFKRGNPDTILMAPPNKKIANEWLISLVQTDITNRRAGYAVREYEYEGKILKIMVDQDVPADRVEILTMANCKKGWLQGDDLQLVKEPAQSSRENKESLQGSLGFVVEGVGYDHLDIYGIDNSGGE